jgi:anti-anti-sigma factor
LTAIDRFLPPFRGCVIVFGVDQEVADPDFSATREVVDGRVVVTVTGEVDMSTAGDMYQTSTADGARAAVLDLRAVTFFDSAAIHALLRLAEHYGPHLNVRPSPQVHRVLEISGLATQPWLDEV